MSTHESHGDEDEPESERALAAILTALPARVFYLTASGKDLWCRRPYTFVFSTGQAAERFAAAMGSELDLVPIAVATTELISTEGVAALRRQAVSRVFVDPQIDPVSGDVHGQILRLETPVEERV